MAEKFDYSRTENHVMTRLGISQPLRECLFELPREQWKTSPGFHAEPEFWLQIHRGLLQASAALPEQCRALLENPNSDLQGQVFRGIISFSSRLVDHAHQHHHIEDSHFFPMFAQQYPKLSAPLMLLDGDHKVLSEVLDDMEKATRLMRAEEFGTSVFKGNSLRLTEVMLASAETLNTLFRRHICDEEEICVPVLLKMTGGSVRAL